MAASGSPFPFPAPSTIAATISSRYFVNVKPSISFNNASGGEASRFVLSLLSRFVCFFSDESRLPEGPIIPSANIPSGSLDAAHVLDPRSNIGRLYPVVLYAWDTWRYSRLSTSCPLGALPLILIYDRSKFDERRVLYRCLLDTLSVND
jgi:hypothetical protein